MNDQNQSVQLAQYMADLDEAAVFDLVRQRIDKQDDPLSVIEDCQAGMRKVGERYQNQQYFLSGLILAGDILREVMEIIQPEIEKKLSGRSSGVVMLGTVQGDIHDLGKNVFHMLLCSYGFTVHDLGVNVCANEFAEQYSAIKPDIVGLSGLLTASYRVMRETVTAISTTAEQNSHQVSFIIGGNIDKQVFDFVGADYWTLDAMEGVQWCLDHVKIEN